MGNAKPNSLDVKFGLCVGYPLRKNKYPIKTNILDTIKISSKVEDCGKRLRDYDMRIGTRNVRTIHRISASAQMMGALMKSRTDITAMQEMMWVGLGCRRLVSYDVYCSCHVDKHE